MAAIVGDCVYEAEEFGDVWRGRCECFSVFPDQVAELRVDGFDGVAQCVLEFVCSVGRCPWSGRPGQRGIS